MIFDCYLVPAIPAYFGIDFNDPGTIRTFLGISEGYLFGKYHQNKDKQWNKDACNEP
jgi:hypothetical protein